MTTALRRTASGRSTPGPSCMPRSAPPCTASSAPSSISSSPGSNNVSIRPAYALVPFFGIAFGPIVGFFTGLVGNALLDQINGYGAFTAWNWSIANGLAGLVAGLFAASMADPAADLVKPDRRRGVHRGRSDRDRLSVRPDRHLGLRQHPGGGAHRQLLVRDRAELIASVILTPILVAAWDPLKDAIGR